MRSLKTGVLFLLFSLMTACGQQLVEFPGDAAVPGSDAGTNVDAGTSPTVVSTNPSNAATSVAINAPVTATFSTEMDPATLATAFTLKQGMTPVASEVAYLGTTATLTPVGNMASNSVFTATVSTMGKDVNGRALAMDYTWSFTTDAHIISPTVIATSPVNAATNVSTNKRITATFNKGMNPATINTSTFTVRQGATAVPGSVTWSAATNTATFTPASPLGLSLPYTATVSTGVQDRSGSSLATNYEWSFTTGACSQLPVALSSAGNFAVLAGSTVTSTGQTSVTGDLGVSPGTEITGFPPGALIGAKHAGDPTAAQGIADLTTAYNDAAGRTLCPVTVAGNLGGQTLEPGLYKSTSSLAISAGDLTLDAKGDADAVFIFQMASTLTTTAGRQVILTGGARSTHIFWQVGTSATFGTTSSFQGTVMADQSITLNTGATLNGRALTRIGAVSLDGNKIVKPAP
ncbi:ice-binding family protein [Archangium sp.]|uniref:ice-binding family protein n=1 Tax=Archangium sp. TaxID=1872627 RepID=UPI00286C8B3F|nr:ice-binding family protein [Archangium sp.]